MTIGKAGPTIRGRLLGAASAGAVLAGLVLPIGAAAPDTPRQVVWTFDRLDKIGGVTPHVEGHPTVINTPLGKAIEFNGVDDLVDPLPAAVRSTTRARLSSRASR